MRVKHEVISKSKIPYFRIIASIVVELILVYLGCVWIINLSGEDNYSLGRFIAILGGIFVILFLLGWWWSFIRGDYLIKKKKVIVNKIK